jgi:hypothetical protein
MKNERIWSYVKETTSHLQNKLTKNIHLGVATRSSSKWDCLKPIHITTVHYLQMCMKKYGFCPKFGRGDNLTYTLKYVLYGEMGL